MTQESEFIRLEETVNNLLKRYSVLKAAKEALEIRVKNQDQEIDELRFNIQNMQSERGDVSDRVSSLLDQIEQWEQDLEEGGIEAQEETEAVQVESSEIESVLDEEEALEEYAQEEEDSAESRQGNLFSVDSNVAS